MKKILLSFFVLLNMFQHQNANAQVQIGQDIDGEAAEDISGRSVSMSSDGNTVAIGATLNSGNGTEAGHVRIYTWSGSAWAQKGIDIDGEAAGDHSGTSVSLSSDGNTVAIGAPNNDGNGTNAGHVRIYSWNGFIWEQKGADIDGEAEGDRSGESISLSSDGNTVAIGAKYNDGITGNNNDNRGHVRVYSWNGSVWVQKGTDIDGESMYDQSGASVSLSSDGNTVAIGATLNSANGSAAGHVRIYGWSGSAWEQKGTDIDGEAAWDYSGTSVSLSSNGSTVAIGAPSNDGDDSEDVGHVRVYSWNGSAWAQKGIDIDGEMGGVPGDNSGTSVSLSSDGNTVAIGAPGNGSAAGHVRVYIWNNSVWEQKGTDIDGEAAFDRSGMSVSLSSDGNTVAIGAALNSGNGMRAGHVRVYSFCSTFGIDVQTACETYTWIDGNTYTSSNNTATYTLTNAASCDSLVTLNLTIFYTNDLDLSISQTGNTLTVAEAGANYQWFVCNDTNLPLGNGQSFTPTESGSYYVIVTKNGCTDESDCQSITVLGTIDTSTSLSMTNIYPNPNNGSFTLAFGIQLTNATIYVKDVLGKTIYITQASGDKLNIQLNEAKGIYFVSIQTEQEERTTLKLLVE
jgi:hypothetical protein